MLSRRSVRRSRRRGVSFLEVVLGAIILGLSGVTILELVRSNTVNLQITEIEAVARNLAADTLERFSHRSSYATPTMMKLMKKFQGVPLPWKDVVTNDPALGYKVPLDDVGKLLDLYDVKLSVQIKANKHPSFGPKPRMRQIEVSVLWNDPRATGNTSSELKSVTYASIID